MNPDPERTPLTNDEVEAVIIQGSAEACHEVGCHDDLSRAIDRLVAVLVVLRDERERRALA